jgi:hypothetical protein
VILWILLLIVSSATGLVGYAKGQQNSAGTRQLLQKTASIIDIKSAANGRPEITIRLYGLQPVDLVNIRQKAASLSVSAGTLVRSTRLYERTPYERLHYEAVSPGSPLPDAALEVTSGQVIFFRPTVSDDIVFLDIEIPLRARVRVLQDDELVLKASLTEPLALRDREWGEGALGVPGTAMRSAMPLLSKRNLSDQSAYDRSKGSHVVPFSKLQVLKKLQLRGQYSQSIVVVLQIDETGSVVRVTPLTAAPPPDLERTIKKWRFVPYEVQGRAVAVTTTLTISANSN